MSDFDHLPDWEKLLAAERHLQQVVAGSVLVGGTPVALHALESVAGWQTNRIQRPVLIVGALDGILTGIRQLRRTMPLETEEVEGLRGPTLEEMARIKAWLLATRYTAGDYLDTVVLCERLGEAGVAKSFRGFRSLVPAGERQLGVVGSGGPPGDGLPFRSRSSRPCHLSWAASAVDGLEARRRTGSTLGRSTGASRPRGKRRPEVTAGLMGTRGPEMTAGMEREGLK